MAMNQYQINLMKRCLYKLKENRNLSIENEIKANEYLIELEIKIKQKYYDRLKVYMQYSKKKTLIIKL